MPGVLCGVLSGNTTIVCDAWPVRRQTYGYLPRRKASPPVGWYQIILLGDRGTCVLINNLPKVALDRGEARIRTRDLLIASPASTTRPPSHAPKLAKVFATRMLTRDLFALANRVCSRANDTVRKRASSESCCFTTRRSFIQFHITFTFVFTFFYYDYFSWCSFSIRRVNVYVCVCVCVCIYYTAKLRRSVLPIVIAPVCLCVCGSVTTITRNCVHRSSPNWVCRWR